LTSGGKQ